MGDTGRDERSRARIEDLQELREEIEAARFE